MGLENALQSSATDKELSSLWWHGMRSAKTKFHKSFLCVLPLSNLFVVIANKFDAKRSQIYSKG